jgi:plastocyanin
MVRRLLMVAAATLLLGLVVPAMPASAGGGCHAGATTGEGDTVEMVDACFTPSTLQVDPGAEVAFVNRDSMVHNVTAIGWGNFEDMTRGDAFTATFAEPGIYPFACAYHPGMAGAIVVGNGLGAGNGEVVTVTSLQEPALEQPATETELAAADVGTAASGGGSVVGWIGGGVIGLALGIGVAALARRGTRGTPTP